ncbi:MAG: diguanylate cyclase [Campylobacterota bacterium]|nr:diguanylate cyclase [Campylobacterota bacterium]
MNKTEKLLHTFDQKNRLYYLGSFIIVSLLMFALELYTTQQELIQQQRMYHSLAASRVNDYYSRVADVSSQISSRTRINLYLRDYLDGKVTQKLLHSKTTQLISPALTKSDIVLHIRREDKNGNLVTSIGETIDQTLFQRDLAKHYNEKVHLHSIQKINGRPVIIMHSPIRIDKKLIGWDFVVFKIESILESISMLQSRNDHQSRLLYMCEERFISLKPIPFDFSKSEIVKNRQTEGFYHDNQYCKISAVGGDAFYFITFISRYTIWLKTLSNLIPTITLFVLLFIILFGINTWLRRPIFTQLHKLINEQTYIKRELEQAYALFNSGNIVVFKWKNSENWPVEYVSESLETVFGYSPKVFLDGDLQYAQLIHKDDLQQVFEEVQIHSNDKVASFQHQDYRIRRHDDTYAWIADTTRIIYNEEGEITHYIGYIVDITDQKEKEQELREYTERFNLAIESTRDGLWDWNLKTDQLFCSPTLIAMLGYNEKAFKADIDSLKKLIHPDDIQAAEENMQKHLDGKSEYYEGEYRIMTEKGNYKWILNRAKVLFDKTGDAYRVIGFFTDIDRRKEMEIKLEHLSVTDPLTGLLNRNGLTGRFNIFKQSAKRFHRKMALFYIDLDGFKTINDTLGHTAGDEILIIISDRLKTMTRHNEIVARLGGDEFVIFIPEFEHDKDLINLAERLVESCEQPIKLTTAEVMIGMSIGIALMEYDESLDNMLSRADKAMYLVKKSGKNSYAFAKK